MHFIVYNTGLANIINTILSIFSDMKVGCIYEGMLGVKVRVCETCNMSNDYSACVAYRQKHKAEKTKIGGHQ